MSSPGYSADIRQRLNRVQAAELCRFCLTKHELVSIPENNRIQELLTECFGGVLGELTGNSTQFICARCYQRIEQNYEFLLMASRVQALMDTFTYHEGVWPRKAMLDENSKQCEKRAAAFDSYEQLENPVKRPRLSERFGGVLAEMGLDSSSASSSAPNSVEIFQCLTPSILWTDTGSNGSSSGIGGELKSSTVEIVSQGASLETTLSGEIPSEDLEESPASSPVMEQFDLDLSLDDDFYEEAAAVRKFSACELKSEESGKDMALVQKLCVQIEDIEVGERKLGVKSQTNLYKFSANKSVPTRNKTD